MLPVARFHNLKQPLENSMIVMIRKETIKLCGTHASRRHGVVIQQGRNFRQFSPSLSFLVSKWPVASRLLRNVLEHFFVRLKLREKSTFCVPAIQENDASEQYGNNYTVWYFQFE